MKSTQENITLEKKKYFSLIDSSEWTMIENDQIKEQII